MFVDKDLESKIQDDLLLDQECFPKTEVENFMLKALVSDQLLLFQLWSLSRLHSHKRPALVTANFSIPKVVTQESFDCMSKLTKKG